MNHHNTNYQWKSKEFDDFRNQLIIMIHKHEVIISNIQEILKTERAPSDEDALVVPARFELATHGFSVHCSTN